MSTVAMDGEQLSEGYRSSRLRMMALATEIDEAAAELTVPACPEWRVRDLFAHVAGIASDLAAGRAPSGDSQPWVDRQIDERRGRSLDEVVGEWSEVGPTFEDMIASSPRAFWGLTYDTVVHEHDLRNAIGRPGARDNDAVRLAARLGLKLVKHDLGRHGLGAVRLIIDGEEAVVGEGEPGLTLTASSFECLRLLGSRRTLAEMRAAAFVGDLDGFLPGIVHMDLPARSLRE